MIRNPQISLGNICPIFDGFMGLVAIGVRGMEERLRAKPLDADSKQVGNQIQELRGRFRTQDSVIQGKTEFRNPCQQQRLPIPEP